MNSFETYELSPNKWENCFSRNTANLNYKRDSENTKLKEAFGFLKFHWQEVVLWNYSASKTCYLSLKSKKKIKKKKITKRVESRTRSVESNTAENYDQILRLHQINLTFPCCISELSWISDSSWPYVFNWNVYICHHMHFLLLCD